MFFDLKTNTFGQSSRFPLSYSDMSTLRQFGLIGYPLTHSFSKKYFTEKFEKENIHDCSYELFELPHIEDFPTLLQSKPHLQGLNVTIPYKEQVLPYLDGIDDNAARIGAVNVIKINPQGKLYGYNSDCLGFQNSLSQWLEAERCPLQGLAALVLGTGGAAKAVKVALENLGIAYTDVSRQAVAHRLSYEQVNAEVLANHRLLVNTTPLGMAPHSSQAVALPWQYVGAGHYFYDLVYNPALTASMQAAAAQGAKVKNGLEMLHLQAEEAWAIWNKPFEAH